MRWDEGRFRRRAFRWSERRRRQEVWRLLRVVLPFALAVTLLFVTASALAIIVVARTVSHPPVRLQIPPTVSPEDGVALQQSSATPSPTPDLNLYQMGAWASEFSPPAGGRVLIFVRVSVSDRPLPNVPVTIVVNASRFGPAKTDAYGLATFTVSYGDFADRPVFVTASATIGGQSLTQETSFVPR